jgi:hypothetical protein
MIRPLYEAVRGRRWNRDRRRHISEMRRLEEATRAHKIHPIDAMAAQLTEIRSLPEASEPLAMSCVALRRADEAVAGLVDEMLAGYIDWREGAAAARDSYTRWCNAPAGEKDSRFSAYMAALDQEESAAARYALGLEHLQRSL